MHALTRRVKRQAQEKLAVQRNKRVGNSLRNGERILGIAMHTERLDPHLGKRSCTRSTGFWVRDQGIGLIAWDECSVLTNTTIREALDWPRYQGTDRANKLMPPADSVQHERLQAALAQNPKLLDEMRAVVPALFDF